VKKVFLLIFLVLFVISCQTYPQQQCPDLDYSKCPKQVETKVETKTITTYVCSDLTEVKNKLDCLKADSDGWYEVTSFTGSNARKTDSFKINSNKWRYTASCSSGTGFNLIVYDVNNPGGTYVDTVLLGQCGKSEPNYVYSGPGEYYFDMGAVNIDSWTIKVEAQK